MKKLTHDEISKNRSTLDTLHEVKKMPVQVVLDNIRSAYNVGSIFRTSDGAMIEKLNLCGYTPFPPQKEVLKTALGSHESVSWEHSDSPVELLQDLKNKGYKICSLEQTDSSVPYYELNENDFPLCLVVGNEITGVAQELIDLSDIAIEIPQYGIKQSLNVAVAYGIAIFELRKIFDLKKDK
jgi:tRNA G18 (ribose-2'-O)-methylase SpoU